MLELLLELIAVALFWLAIALDLPYNEECHLVFKHLNGTSFFLGTSVCKQCLPNAVYCDF